MKIKTLAEILAESETDSVSTPRVKSKNPTTPSKRSSPSTPSYKTKQLTKTRKRSIHSDKEQSVYDDSMVDVAPSDSPSLTHQDPSKSKKHKKRKKRFHPAANFVPEPSDVPVYQPPEAQSIKEMLAEVKRDVHDATINSDDQQKSSPKTLKQISITYPLRSKRIYALQNKNKLRLTLSKRKVACVGWLFIIYHGVSTAKLSLNKNCSIKSKIQKK